LDVVVVVVNAMSMLPVAPTTSAEIGLKPVAGHRWN